MVPCQTVLVEQETDEQWSWWQAPDTPPTSDPASAPGAPPATGLSTTELPTTDAEPAESVLLQHDERVRKVLIGLVALLTISLAAASYARFGPDGTAQTVASASVDPPPTATATTGSLPSTTSQVPATSTSQPTTTSAPTTTSTVPKTSSTTVPAVGAPKPPVNLSVVSTGPTSAEIHWESAECVGSLYQVGSFSEGRGGYPNVDRCWFNHVVLAGDENFSPPLTPNTEYVVRVQAVNKSGQASDPVEITFRTTSG